MTTTRGRCRSEQTHEPRVMSRPMTRAPRRAAYFASVISVARRCLAMTRYNASPIVTLCRSAQASDARVRLDACGGVEHDGRHRSPCSRSSRTRSATTPSPSSMGSSSSRLPSQTATATSEVSVPSSIGTIAGSISKSSGCLAIRKCYRRPAATTPGMPSSIASRHRRESATNWQRNRSHGVASTDSAGSRRDPDIHRWTRSNHGDNPDDLRNADVVGSNPITSTPSKRNQER